MNTCPRCGFEMTRFNCAPVCPNFFCERDEKLSLATLTPAQCAARGIRHSSTDNHSTAVHSDGSDWLLQGALRAAGRKYR